MCGETEPGSNLGSPILYRRSDPSQIRRHAGHRGWEPLYYVGDYPVHGPTAICHLHGKYAVSREIERQQLRYRYHSASMHLHAPSCPQICIHESSCPGAQVPLARRTRSLQIIPPIHATDRSEHPVHCVSNPTSTHWNNPTMRGRKVGAENCGDRNLAASAVRILQKAKGEDRIAEASVSPRRAGEACDTSATLKWVPWDSLHQSWCSMGYSYTMHWYPHLDLQITRTLYM